MGKLEGKVAIITGGTSGIGAASAELFAFEGAKVIACGRDENKGRNFVEKLSQENIVVDYFKCDVTKKNDIENLKKYVTEKYGKLDILFNNAGVLLTASLEEITDEDWDTTYEINVKSVMHMCQSFIEMIKVSEGVILNNASVNGLQSYIKGARSYMYASSKAAVIQFTKYLAKNYAPSVRVNAICPGVTETDIFTNRDFSRFKGNNLLDRIGNPIEIAKAALFLCSDDSSFITGIDLIVDGGEITKDKNGFNLPPEIEMGGVVL